MNDVQESVLSFHCEGDPLVGILAEPASSMASALGVVIVVGGPQYRAGSHRQFTLLARDLAQANHVCLRFDYRGMGDSGGAARSFEAVQADIRAAIDALLAARRHLDGVVIWGLCDAASAALMYVEASSDPRVAGLVLANPWVRSAASLAQAHVKHYYWQRLREPDFWRKLLGGGVGRAALAGLWANVRLARSVQRAAPRQGPSHRSFQEQMASGLRKFARPVLLVLSGQDLTAREFVEHAKSATAWSGLLDQARMSCHELPDADHTFSDLSHTRSLFELTRAWLDQLPKTT